MPHLGIDVSKEKLDVCINGQSGQFENNLKGFKGLIAWLKKKKLFKELYVCLESTGTYGLAIAEYMHGTRKEQR